MNAKSNSLSALYGRIKCMASDSAVMEIAGQIRKQKLWETLRGRQLIRHFLRTVDAEGQKWEEHFKGQRNKLAEHELFWEKRLMKLIKIFSEKRKHSSRLLRIITLLAAATVCIFGFVFLTNLNNTIADLAAPVLLIPAMISTGFLAVEIKHPNRALLDVFNEALLD
jgi:ABC-type multidrug transport system fused ATPase/permease subunit